MLLALAVAGALPCCRHGETELRAEPDHEAVAVEVAAPEQTTPEEVAVGEGVVAYANAGIVELDAVVCLDVGWLEQIACSPGSREHESLMVVPARPSMIHLALTIAGLEHGEPGHWSLTDDEQDLLLVPPRGDAVTVDVRYVDGSGATVEEPVAAWVRDDGPNAFPRDTNWVFAGSGFAENPEWMEPGEHYIADVTGSVIGLVTFGDEVIGFAEVRSDQESVQAPEWEVDPTTVPPLGTPVTIVLRAVPDDQ